MTECRKFRVEGRVQGVWFRDSTRQKALQHGISGYARNCPDGSVEVLACGAAADISALKDWLRQGPPMAEVTHLAEQDCDDSPPDGFTTG